MIRRQGEIAKMLKVVPSTISMWKKESPMPEFFVLGPTGVWMIDDEHPDFLRRVARLKITAPVRESKKKTGEGKKKNKSKLDFIREIKDNMIPEDRKIFNGLVKNFPEIKEILNTSIGKVLKSREPDELDFDEDLHELQKKAAMANLQKEIADSLIKEEKVKQEVIKTLELKKDLAPIDLLKHFFSFAENIIYRLYRRPHEISPQLASFFLGGEEKKAVKYLVDNLVLIVEEVREELIKELEEEQYKIEKKLEREIEEMKKERMGYKESEDMQ